MPNLPRNNSRNNRAISRIVGLAKRPVEPCYTFARVPLILATSSEIAKVEEGPGNQEEAVGNARNDASSRWMEPCL